MIDRLTNQTGPKILKSLEANVRAIESDKLLQDASFSLESRAASTDQEKHQELHA